MNDDQRIEDYLSKLDADQRAAAERYLRPRRRTGRVFKWVAIGTVALFGCIFAGGIAALWYFSPLVKIDGARGRVTLLGGLIDVNKEIGQVKIGDLVVNGGLDGSVEVKGEVKSPNATLIKIPFNTARIEVEYTTDQSFSWSCKGATKANVTPVQVAGILTLNLDPLNIVKCTIRLPVGARSEFRGVNGNMDLEYPDNNVDIALNNGKVNIKPDPLKVYDFQVKVKNGLQDFFPRSTDKRAVHVKVDVVNGLVKKR